VVDFFGGLYLWIITDQFLGPKIEVGVLLTAMGMVERDADSAKLRKVLTGDKRKGTKLSP